jgi:cytochrome P450
MRHDHDHEATETATAGRAGIRAELLIAILAGTSTTATVIHALFVQVGSVPAVAARLRQELDQEHAAACSSSSSSSSPPDSTSLARLPYLTACIHEAFRLSAMPTQFPRRVGAARSVVIDGHVLPPDTVLSSSSYILSRDQQLFGDAVDEFHPERWLDVDPVTAARRARYDFRFGYGARTCLGKHLVMLELYHAADAFFRVLDVRVDEGKKVLLRLRNNDVVEGGK